MRLKNLLLIACCSLSALVFTVKAQNLKGGKASYYANSLHGHRTSDGSVYHRDSLTCAHRTLPFGTMLKVRNLSNGKEVIVKVTDRGPFSKSRVVDLSLAAAKQLDMVGKGTASVEVTRVGGGVIEEYTLPELQLLDPKTGNYYSMSEWNEKERAAKQLAQQREAEKRRAAYLAKAKQQQPRWRVLDNKLTAKAKK